MEFLITHASSEADNAFFIEEEYDSAKENGMVLTDRPEEEARQTFLDDLEGYIQGLKHNQVYVAKSAGGEYAGMIWLAQRTSKEPWDFSKLPGWVYDIRVRPEFRGNGLGRALLEKARVWAEEAELDQVGLHVFGSNKVAINLYTTSGYQALYQYLQKDITPDNLKASENSLIFRPCQSEKDLDFSRKLLSSQYHQRAMYNANPDTVEVSNGFEKSLETYNFGNPKKELIIAEDSEGKTVGLLWFYISKGDLGKRRYIWLHAVQAVEPEHLPHLLAYLEHWAVEQELDAIRTPVHQSEGHLGSMLLSFDYQPANLFMYKSVSN